MALMPRKVSAKASVMRRQTTAARCRPVRTKWMASATVSELVISTTVFRVPAQISLVRADAANAMGNEYRYTAYPVKSPAKSSTSVQRNSHMPSREASTCLSRLEKWWARCGSAPRAGCSPGGSAAASDIGVHPAGRMRPVVVRVLGDVRDPVEVVGGWRRLGQPLETFRAPGVLLASRAPAQRDHQVDEDDDEAEAEQRGARGGGDVQRLEVFRVLVVAARHPVVAQQELRDEGCIEPEDDERGGHQAPSLVVGAAEHLREPVVKGGEEGHDHGAEHDEVEVGHDEVRVVPEHDERHGRERDPGHAPEHQEEEEPADVRE